MADTEIGIWGDSLTYGESDIAALGWVGRFRKSLPLTEWSTVYNRGVCGDTTKDLLKRFPIEAESIQPTVIVFAIGINDSKYPANQEGSNVSIDDFKRNLQMLIEEGRKYTEKIFIVSLTKVNETAIGSSSKFRNEQIEIYNDSLATIAEANKLEFIDFMNVLDVETDLYDGLHPNARGYEKLSKIAIDSIRI
jgi:lysophospholipase L1-like esterase